MPTAFRLVMSTPSSIVGEQYSTGSSASRNSPRAPAGRSAGPGRCARAARSPARVAATSRYRSRKNGLTRGPSSLSRVARGAGRGAPDLPSPAMPADQRAALEPVAGRVAARRLGDRLDEQAGAAEYLEQVGDDLLGVGGRELDLLAWRYSRAAGSAERAAAGQEQIVARAPPGLPGPRERDAASWRPFAFRRAPTALEMLAEQALQPLEPVLGQALDLDGEVAAQLVEQRPARLRRVLRVVVAQRRVACLPRLVVGGSSSRSR